MPGIQDVLEILKRDEKAAIQRLIDWLKIPSISTDPKYAGDVRSAGEWAAAHLRESGFTVETRETGGHPIIWATCPGEKPISGGKSPHVLFYGHYDVQPADPLELWESPPFAPVIKPASGELGERIVARGACDDKGQVMMFLEAVRAWKLATGKVGGGVRFSVMLEGEEESGSANLGKYLEAHADELKACDVCLISDTGMLGRKAPAITYGVRGLVYTEVVLHGADQDLHSGLWGGRAPNPITELTKVLAQLWDANQHVTIPGFYDAVRPLTPGERSAWKALPFNAADALKRIGLPPEADRGEAGFTALEREWARPTAEINGINGGYTGHGAKTVIPAKASAKVSFRLVADQDPEVIRDAFFDFCRRRTPPGCRWEFRALSRSPCGLTEFDNPFLIECASAVRDATLQQAYFVRSGGSIPAIGMLSSTLGVPSLSMGFALDEDRAHSPNECFETERFRDGTISWTYLIERLQRHIT